MRNMRYECPETLRLRDIQAFGYLVIFSTSPNIYILLGKVRSLLEAANERLSKKLEWSG